MGWSPRSAPAASRWSRARPPAGIEIRVNDSGLGLPADEEDEPAARPAGTSYGLQHVRDRLQAVYGPAARLSLERRHPTGVSALVFIPT